MPYGNVYSFLLVSHCLLLATYCLFAIKLSTISSSDYKETLRVSVVHTMQFYTTLFDYPANKPSLLTPSNLSNCRKCSHRLDRLDETCSVSWFGLVESWDLPSNFLNSKSPSQVPCSFPTSKVGVGVCCFFNVMILSLDKQHKLVNHINI